VKTIKKTVDELANAMLRSGVSTTAIKNVLLELGFPGEKVEQAINEIHADTMSNNSAADQISTSDKESLTLLQEEVERQRLFIQSLQEEVNKLALAFSKLSQEVRIAPDGPIQSDLEARMASLEASVNGIIDAISEYVPAIVERLRAPR